MVVPLSKLINNLISLGIIFGFAYLIYMKTIKKKDVMENFGDKLSGNDVAFRRGKI